MLSYTLVYLCSIATVLHAATISTPPQIISVAEGSTARLDCQVDGLLESQTVIWQFVEQNITISTGNDIRVDGGPKQYEIYRPEDGNRLVHWNLAVFDIELSDMGSYMCFVMGEKSSASVTHHIKVINAGAPSVPILPNLDVTKCCKERNVDPCALPVCDTSTPITTLFGILNNGSCIDNEIVKILGCAQDGRNHMGCCMRSNFSSICLDLCEGHVVDGDQDYRSCIGIATSINLVKCFREGQFLLPSQPESVSAISIGDGVMVTWQPPFENVDKVTGFRVQYRKKGTEHFNSSIPQTNLYYTVRPLEKNTVYEVRVIALAAVGSSQPSYMVDIATGEPVDQRNLTKTIQDCCQSKNVSADCQMYCSANTFNMIGHPDMIIECQSELETMYSCLGGQGNHKPCCQRVQVPEMCYPLCEGHIMMTWEVSQCIVYMPLISACMIEGSMLLPSPPTNTYIVPGSVTATTAEVQWDQPDDFKTGMYFVVAWKLDKSKAQDWETTSVIQGTRHQIVGLEPESVYDVIVSTVNDKGSSLPELTLILITEGVQPEVPPYNETECCMRKGVTLECLDICSHTFRLTEEATTRGLQCANYVLSMLECATDGRDHTECCTRSGVSDDCVDLCNPAMAADTDDIPCFIYTNEFSICFDEGKAILPKPPVQVSIKKIATNAILVNWMAPTGPNVTSYLLEYSMNKNLPWMKRPTNNSFLNVDSLTPNTMYYFRVSSINTNGTSLPSNMVLASTATVSTGPPPTVDWNKVWQNRSDCCDKTISEPCRASCKNSENMNKTLCTGELDKIIVCGTDGRDHTACCKKTPTFPNACLPYCQGQTPPRDVTSALCLNYVGFMFTCFTEGQGLLPTPPTSVRVTSYTHTTIVLAWDKPVSNCDTMCGYQAMIWQEGYQDSLKKFDTKSLSYTFLMLSPKTKYYVTVMSLNDKGMSLLSPSVIVTTQSDPSFDVSVSQYPSGVIDSGAKVQLECVATGYPAKVSWMRLNNYVSNNNTYVMNVNQKSQGVYTCIVVYDITRTENMDLYLNVKYEPKPVNMSEDTVLPGLNLDAMLQCEFLGFPDIVSWTKKGQALQGNKYHLEALDTQLGKGKTTSKLWVRDVVDDDYSTYTCTGKNKFGSQSISGSLQNLYPTRPPLPTRPPTQNTEACCRARGVPADCITDICTYSIDLMTVVSTPSKGKCIEYIDDYVACGADGKNHSKCCTEAGVDEYCLPFCSGIIPKYTDSVELVKCLSHADKMMNCLVDGQRFIPTAPRNVRAILRYDTVQVIWDKPVTNSDKVHLYEVYYKSGRTDPIYGSVSKSTLSYQLPAAMVTRGEEYTVWVVAVNDFGTSTNSNTFQIQVTRLTPTEPQNLHGTLVSDVFISLTWDAPETSVKVIGYTVTFRPYSPKGDEISVNMIGTKTRLEYLNENTRYRISVTARSDDGPGKMSNYIYVMTGHKTAIVGTTDQQSSKQETVGLAVGLVLAIIFLIAVAFVAVLLYRRITRKKLGQEIHDTVSFENPSYNRAAKISGLPGDPGGPSVEDDNQFGYGQLREDSDMDHGYSTVGNQQMDAPATLNLENRESY